MYSTNDWILNPTHRIKVALIGVGGTGSFVLPELVALSKTLKQLDRDELEIHVFDNDIIELHNCGRQKFFESDIGKFKAETLVNRVNRAYSSDVEFYNIKFNEEEYDKLCPNIIITCVDNLKTREIISQNIYNKNWSNPNRNNCFYWIDTGNSKDYGQVIISDTKEKNRLKNIFELHPDIKEDKNEPSCSLRASLAQQSFMINKLTGIYCLEMLSSLLLNFNILHSEIYFSLNPINVKTNSL